MPYSSSIFACVFAQFEPIEQAFSKLKAHLREAEAKPSTHSGKPSVTPAIRSSLSNAGTISRPPDMRPFHCPML
jgi:hypothetical protein